MDIAALAYGTFFLSRRASPLRTVLKTLPVGALAVAVLANGAPWPLVAALALSALGDAFLAGDGERWLPPGLGAFLLAHLAYVWLFVDNILDANLFWPAEGAPSLAARGLACLAVVGAAALMLRWLWSSLGGLRPAVLAYVAAIVAMVVSSFWLVTGYVAVMVGAVLFFASDAILSAQIFRKRLKSTAGRVAVWGLYFVAQVLIAGAYGFSWSSHVHIRF